MAECPGGEGTLMWSLSVDVPFGMPLGSDTMKEGGFSFLAFLLAWALGELG